MQAKGSRPVMPFVLAGAAGDDMGATTHLWLRLFEVASIKGREYLIVVAIGQHTGAVDIFLSPDATLSAVQCADILSNIFSPFMFLVVLTASSKVAVPRPAMSMFIKGRKNEVRHIGRGPLLFDRLSEDAPGGQGQE